MGNLPFTCPSTNFNVQHWRDEDDEDAPDNEYEVVMCKACAVALDQPKDRKSSGTRGRGPAKHWVKVKNRKHPAMERVMDRAVQHVTMIARRPLAKGH
jgi:hypothetical protein